MIKRVERKIIGWEKIFLNQILYSLLSTIQIILTIQHQWQQQQRQIITSVSNDMEKVVGPWCTVGGKVKWCSRHGKQHLKRWNRTTVWSGTSTSKCTVKAVTWEQRLKQYTNVHGSIIHSCQKVTITQCQSVDDGPKNVGYAGDGIWFRLKNERVSGICYNRDEPRKHDMKWKKPGKNSVWFHFLEVPTIVKLIETRSPTVVTRSRQRRK